LCPGSSLASGFPGPRQDFQVHFRISKSTSGFPVPRQDFQVHFGRPGPLWPIRSTLADQVHLAQVDLAVRFRDQFW
jgi:hypothetical protein